MTAVLLLSEVMQEKRRHQRIRFGLPLSVQIGYDGCLDIGTLENLSLSGFMVRTSVPLVVGKKFGCEFSISGHSRIDAVAVTISSLGNLFGARFQEGPINDLLVRDAIEEAIANGSASSVSTHVVQGKRVLSVSGGLNATLENDFVYGLTKAGVEELDLSEVTCVDAAGIELCKKAMRNHGVSLGTQSPCFILAWNSWA